MVSKVHPLTHALGRAGGSSLGRVAVGEHNPD